MPVVETIPGQPEPLGLEVQLAPPQPRCGQRRPRRRVDPHQLHQRQIDHDAVVAGARAGHVVSAAPHGQRQPVLAGEPDRGEDVGTTPAPGHQGRVPVDGAVPNAARAVVLLVSRDDHLAAQALPQTAHGPLHTVRLSPVRRPPIGQ
jgi:hypothetical protein